MKKYITIILVLFLISCNQEKYPKAIIESDITDVYDLAKWEIYKLNITFDRDFGYIHGNLNDTVKLVSCDLRLSDLDYSSDTTSMYFNFFFDEKQVFKQYIHNFHTIRFVNKKPVELDFDDVATINFNPVSNSKESEFIEYLKDNKRLLNPWLKKVATEKGYL